MLEWDRIWHFLFLILGFIDETFDKMLSSKQVVENGGGLLIHLSNVFWSTVFWAVFNSLVISNEQSNRNLCPQSLQVSFSLFFWVVCEKYSSYSSKVIFTDLAADNSIRPSFTFAENREFETTALGRGFVNRSLNLHGLIFWDTQLKSFTDT